MHSLDQAYDRRWKGLRSPRRVIAGLCLVGAGVLGIVLSMVFIGTNGQSLVARERAGLAAGLGVPAMLLGIVVVLPASLRQRLGVVCGSLLATGGVWLFQRVYPQRWTQVPGAMAFETLMLYSLGCAVALWFVFSTMASFRLRNNPHGTVTLEVVKEGSTRTIEVSQDQYQEIVSDGGDADAVIEKLDD